METNTRSWIKTLSNPFVPEGSDRLSYWSLFLLGCIAGLLHVHLRYPLNIPGHHGIEWFALLMFGRSLSSYRHASTVLAGGAAASYLLQSPFLNVAHDVKPALIFMLTGICADFIHHYTRNRLPMVINAAVVSGLAFLSKPLIMYCLFIFTGMQVGMFIKHPDYLPFLSHLLFGMVGGAGGALLAKAALTKSKE